MPCCAGLEYYIKLSIHNTFRVNKFMSVHIFRSMIQCSCKCSYEREIILVKMSADSNPLPLQFLN